MGLGIRDVGRIEVPPLAVFHSDAHGRDMVLAAVVPLSTFSRRGNRGSRVGPCSPLDLSISQPSLPRRWFWGWSSPSRTFGSLKPWVGDCVGSKSKASGRTPPSFGHTISRACSSCTTRQVCVDVEPPEVVDESPQLMARLGSLRASTVEVARTCITTLERVDK